MKVVLYLIVLMLFSSLFAGLPVKTGWVLLYMFEFDQVPNEVVPDLGFMYRLLWWMLLLAHSGVFLLLFLTRKSYFRSLLILFPLSFLVLYTIVQPIAIFFLIPFVLLWLLTIVFAWRDQNS